MKPKSVKKKLKQPSFAAGVNRDDVYQGAAELEPETGLSFDEHLQFVIDALAERADELGLTGRQEEAAARD
jgi:predicted hydrolase (HD superfamily)